MDFTDKTKFIELYSKEQKKIFLYILSMVHHRSDAEDLMQQTACQMWQMFDRFEPGTNFAAWGITIAKFRILSYRKQKANNRMFLCPEVYEQVLNEFEKIANDSLKRKNALQGCLKKLNDKQKQMLCMHYEDGLHYKQIAENFDLSASSIYKAMAKLHTNLQNCIRKTLLIWETDG